VRRIATEILSGLQRTEQSDGSDEIAPPLRVSEHAGVCGTGILGTRLARGAHHPEAHRTERGGKGEDGLAEWDLGRRSCFALFFFSVFSPISFQIPISSIQIKLKSLF
jgi:hypothetical protein